MWPTENGTYSTSMMKVAITVQNVMKVNVFFERIDELCYKWFLDATSRQINVSEKEKGLTFASDFGDSEFKASHGWLTSFLERHSIVLNETMS